jgi:hypothetical protein
MKILRNSYHYPYLSIRPGVLTAKAYSPSNLPHSDTRIQSNDLAEGKPTPSPLRLSP